MKKAFRVIALALVAMSLTVACNNNNAEEVVEDTTPVEEVVMDTTPVDTVVAEVIEEAPAAPVAKKPAVKQATQKEVSQKAVTEQKVTAAEAAKSGEMKEGKGNTVNMGAATKKQAASDAFRH